MSEDPLLAKRRIDQFYALLDKRNHFELLGVELETPPEVVKEQYIARAKQWHTDAFVGIELGDRKRKLDEIFQRINEAYEVVGDPVKRSEYLTYLDRKKQGLATDVHSVLRAEGLVDDALAKIRKRDFASALSDLEEAMKLNPDDPLYEVQYAWATYSANKRSTEKREEAIKLLKACIKKQENLVDAYQYLGQIYFEQADYKKAIRWWKGCLEWDSKNMDAARGLRLANTRLEKENRSGIAKFFDKLRGKD